MNKISRIGGKPEDWLREHVDEVLDSFSGQIKGVFLMLDVEPDEDDDSSRFQTHYISWPERDLVGQLFTAMLALNRDHTVIEDE